MKFNRPAGWPDSPEGWLPDPDWLPDPSWPAAPPDWDFWTNEYGIRIRGPIGLYPNAKSSRRPKVFLGVGAGVAGLILGFSAAGGSPDSKANAFAAVPTQPLITSTIQVAGPTITATMTVPGAVQTVKVPGPTVTKTIRRTVTVAAPLVDTGGGAGSSPSSAYYANCAAARAAGAAPLYRGDPGYRAGLDRDGDGVACE